MIQVILLRTEWITLNDVQYYLNTLPIEQQQIVLSFGNETQRLNCLLSRLLLIHVHQKNNWSLDWSNWRVHPDGKPFLENGIAFNFSHTKNIVGIAVSENEVGLDIQYHKLPYNERLIERFHPNEQLWLHQQVDIPKAFYQLWTRKEAFLKAIGTGIRRGLKTDDCTNDRIASDRGTWFTKDLKVEKGYSMAVSSAQEIVMDEIELLNKELLISLL